MPRMNEMNQAHWGCALALGRYPSIKRFETAGIKPKGCVFNDVMLMNVGYRYYRYAYHYGYKK